MSLFLGCSIVYGGISYKAEAALSGGRFLTPSETVAAIGNSLPVTFYDGSDFVTVNAEYLGADTARAVDAFQETDYLKTGINTMIYRFSGSVVNDPQYIAVDFAPLFALYDVEFVYTVAGISATGLDISSSVYQTPQWVWTMANTHETFEGRADYGLHYRCELSNTYAYGTQFDYVPVSWSHQGQTTAFSQRCLFSYATPTDGYYYLAFGCPYISVQGDIDTVTGSTGTTASTDSSGNINVTVDMDETNGILRGIPDAIAGLFIPSDEAIEQFHDDMEDMAEEHLGGLYESFDMLVDFAESFSVVSATDSLAIPEFHIPLSGSDFVFGGFDMPLVYPQLQTLYTALAWLIDFLATTAFLNMCKRKLEIFFVPETEKVV